ncbi:MAG: hypothetical protein LIO44_00790 [Eubacterium sp.]|nr:hypothetical protein [Eubacterium sp.]
MYLTEKGRQAAVEINEIFAEEDRQAEQGLSPDEAEQLKKLLEKFNSSLDSADNKLPCTLYTAIL